MALLVYIDKHTFIIMQKHCHNQISKYKEEEDKVTNTGMFLHIKYASHWHTCILLK